MAEQLTYAKVGGPPTDWNGLRVFKVKTGEEVKEVVEVNTAEQWLRRLKTDSAGKPLVANGQLVIERIRGLFVIKRPDEPAPTPRYVDRPGVQRLLEKS